MLAIGRQRPSREIDRCLDERSESPSSRPTFAAAYAMPNVPLKKLRFVEGVRSSLLHRACRIAPRAVSRVSSAPVL